MRRRNLFGLLVATSLTGVLSSSCREQPRRPASAAWLVNPARRSEKSLIAVLAPVHARSETLVRTLRSELAADFDVFSFGVDRNTSPEDLGAIIRAENPTLVVLVDNPTVNTYAVWAKEQLRPPPGLIVMSSFAEDLKRHVPNSTGIAFEPPAVRVLADARYILGVPIHRVGVVYREGFEGYFSREMERAEREKIQLVGARVGRSPSPREVYRALARLRDADVHALWVPNDNALLTAPLIERAWSPVLERQRIPVIVGVPSLVSGDFHFGTFAAVPDVEAIGVQAADFVYSISENDWKAHSLAIQPPLSVRTYVDVSRARQLGMTPEGERSVDVLVGSSRQRGGRDG